jgi:DNA-directed RNA polymerase subunit K/omega
MHSAEEQERYEKAIEAFERAREIRQSIRDAIEEPPGHEE